MKRFRFILFAALLAAFCRGSGVAYAQHAHGGGGGMSGMSGTHGASGTHGNSASAEGSSNTSNSSPDSVLSRNSKLDGKLTSLFHKQGLLPAGTDLKTACSGFKTLGQCIAALHVSKNLDIPFACLQADVSGKAPAMGTTCPTGTGSSKMSLGKAISLSKPSANAKAEAKKAIHQASEDMEAPS